MQSKIASFEDLIIWQKAQELARKIYKLADENKFIKRDFKLKDQLKSASISISDNIAEGFEYNNNADFYKFLRIAKGSCGETRNKILFVRKMEYIDNITANTLNEEAKQLGKQIGELMRKVKDKIDVTKKGLLSAKRSCSVTHNS
jgi:four helix bundle protein